VSIGSICGGGRYDDVKTGIFGLKNVSGVGNFIWGADRKFYDAVGRNEFIPRNKIRTTQILFLNFWRKGRAFVFKNSPLSCRNKRSKT